MCHTLSEHYSTIVPVLYLQNTGIRFIYHAVDVCCTISLLLLHSTSRSDHPSAMLLSVSTSDWIKGITLSIIATIIGGASKLAIRKSWLMEASLEEDTGSIASPVEYVQLTDTANANSDNESSMNDHNESSLNRTDIIRKKRSAFCLRLSGMVGMTFLNPFCGVLAMNYASPSITAPFSGLTLVWIVLFSELLVGEKPSPKQIMAAALIMFGEVVVAVFGDHTNDQGVTLATLEESYREPGFIVYLVAITLWMVLLVYLIKFSNSLVVQRFVWGVSGGSMTGIQNFMKDSLTMVKANEGIPWYFPVFILLAIGMAFGGLLFLSASMKRYDVTYSSSMFVGSYVVSASLMSAAHYHTFANLNSFVNYVLYPLGLLILMAGVWVLVKEAGEKDSIETERPIEVNVSTSPLHPIVELRNQCPTLSLKVDALLESEDALQESQHSMT